MTKVRELAERINDALGKNAAQALQNMGRDTDFKAIVAERISIIERLVAAEYPTVESGLPKPRSDATDVKLLSGNLLADFILINLEGLVAPNQRAADEIITKFMKQIEDRVTSFKRATRDEAFVEFTDGATKADELLGATLGTRGGK